MELVPMLCSGEVFPGFALGLWPWFPLVSAGWGASLVLPLTGPMLEPALRASHKCGPPTPYGCVEGESLSKWPRGKF